MAFPLRTERKVGKKNKVVREHVRLVGEVTITLFGTYLLAL